jgi:hypothetical protein
VQHVNKLFEDIQEKALQKTAEIIRDVETTMLRTFQFQEASSTAVGIGAGALSHPQGLSSAAGNNREPSSPPPSPLSSGSGSGSGADNKVVQLLDGLREDPLYNELCHDLQFRVVDDVLSGGLEFGCDNFSMDSAYYTSSSTGGDQSFAIGNFDLGARLE